MRVLVACEFSGIVRDAFREQGHDAMSADLLPTERPGPHYQGDVLGILADGWDLMIAHPPCTYLANSGVQHLHKDPTRWGKMEEAKDFFFALWKAPIQRIAIENPVPHRYSQLPSYSLIIQPFQFGHSVQKKTCLWLKNLPNLVPTAIVNKGAQYIGKDGKPNGSAWYQVLGPSKDRWKYRSRTFEGIARAMATQWGPLGPQR
jgi:hypothetical protein